MTTKNIKFFTGLLAVFFLASCSPKLTGTWNVKNFETITPGERTVTLSNIGTIRFNKNGTGEKNLNYSVLGIRYEDKLPFKWTISEEKYVSIESEGSEFSKTWIIMTNKKKVQKWQSTDGNKVQVIELMK